MDTEQIKTLEQLKQRLEQKEAELTATQKGLESISYTISHDLRAPLRTIDDFSQALTDDFGQDLPEEAMQHLVRIRKATRNMRSMIDELLELSRVGRRKIEPQEFSLTKLCHEIIDTTASEDTERNVEVIISPDMTCYGDKTLIKTLMQQLISNAWKFTRKVDQPRIEIMQNLENGKKVYCVKDNGEGFDMTYYDNLFDPFKYLHSDKEFEGLGVGLTKARQIVERQNGKIWADSEPGK